MTELLINGLVDFTWVGYVAYTLAVTHITIVAITLYLHRGVCHSAIEIKPILSHFFRFWLWLTTSMRTADWVAIHRKHHAKVETIDDPHSPAVFGINNVLFRVPTYIMMRKITKKQLRNIQKIVPKTGLNIKYIPVGVTTEY